MGGIEVDGCLRCQRTRSSLLCSPVLQSVLTVLSSRGYCAMRCSTLRLELWVSARPARSFRRSFSDFCLSPQTYFASGVRIRVDVLATRPHGSNKGRVTIAHHVHLVFRVMVLPDPHGEGRRRTVRHRREKVPQKGRMPSPTVTRDELRWFCRTPQLSRARWSQLSRAQGRWAHLQEHYHRTLSALLDMVMKTPLREHCSKLLRPPQTQLCSCTDQRV